MVCSATQNPNLLSIKFHFLNKSQQMRVFQKYIEHFQNVWCTQILLRTIRCFLFCYGNNIISSGLLYSNNVAIVELNIRLNVEFNKLSNMITSCSRCILVLYYYTKKIYISIILTNKLRCEIVVWILFIKIYKILV